MALKLGNRVKETTATTATSDFSLDGAISGHTTFAAEIGDGNTVYYFAFLGAQWEGGIGTVVAGSPDTLQRTTVIASSNSNSKVSFSAGTKTVISDVPATKMLFLSAAGQLEVPAGSVAAPGLVFAGDADTGFGSDAANEIFASVGGAEGFRVTSGGVQVSSRVYTDFDQVTTTQTITGSGGVITFPNVTVPAHTSAEFEIHISGGFYYYTGKWTSLSYPSNNYAQYEEQKHLFQQAGPLSLALTDSAGVLTPALTIGSGGSGSSGTHTFRIYTLVKY